MLAHEPKHLLAPVDLSDASKSGLLVARDFATRLHADLTVILVREPWTDPTAVCATALADFVNTALGEDHKAATEVIDGAFSSDAIVDRAKEAEAAWICMSTAGRRGWRRLFLGSVTAEVVRHSPVPVLTYRDRQTEDKDYVFDDFRRVLVATDLSEGHEALLDAAVHLAGERGEVALLHVLEAAPEIAIYGEPLRFPAEDVAAARTWVEGALEAAAQRLDEKCRGRCHIEVGLAAHRILALEEELQPDVTVVGTHGRTGLGRWALGSVAERIVRHAKGPVLVVPTGRRA